MNRAAPTIVVADLKEAWRDGRLPVLLALSLLVAIVSGWTGAERIRRYEAERTAAQAQDYRTWMSQSAGNPHTAAHFGHMAFKPLTRLAAFDPGLSAYLGSTVWLEAHWQNPANNRAAEDTLEAQRLADLSPAWAFQVLAPLAIIGLGFPLLARERESGQWRSIAASGLSPDALLAARALSLAALSLVALSPLIAGAALAPMLSGAPTPPDAALRGFAMAGVYGLYLAAFAAVVLAVSAWAGTARKSLAILAGIWVLAIVIVPRVSAAAADRAAPTPTAQAFWATVGEGLEKGLAGHAPPEQRAKAFEARILREYGVSRKEDLPVSFVGLALQQGEAEGDAVFGKHFADLYGAYERQREAVRVFAAASPLIALREASQVLAGADERHHRHFAAAAEAHRQRVIALLNADMIRKGAGKDFDYVAEAPLWRTIPPYRYELPRLQAVGSDGVATALLTFAGWTLTAGLLAAIGVRRWNRT